MTLMIVSRQPTCRTISDPADGMHDAESFQGQRAGTDCQQGSTNDKNSWRGGVPGDWNARRPSRDMTMNITRFSSCIRNFIVNI